MTPFSSLFFKDTATTELYTLSLHDALPIFGIAVVESIQIIFHSLGADSAGDLLIVPEDRKSTRLNSSHVAISYAVFCLKKKNSHRNIDRGSVRSLIKQDLEQLSAADYSSAA